MAHRKRHLIAFLFATFTGVFLSTQALAQTQTPTPAAAKPATFRLISLGEAEPLRYDIDKRTTITVGLNTTSYSRPYQLPADGLLRFYRMGESTDPKLPPPKIPVAEIRVPVSAANTPTIVILIPGGLPGRPLPILENGKPAEFSSIILDDSPTASPKDHMRVISFSKRPVGVKLGTQSVQLKPFDTHLIPYPTGSRTSLLVATFALDTWQPIVSTIQMLAPDTRITLFLTDPPPVKGEPPSNDLNLRKVIEILPKSEAGATKTANSQQLVQATTKVR